MRSNIMNDYLNDKPCIILQQRKNDIYCHSNMLIERESIKNMQNYIEGSINFLGVIRFNDVNYDAMCRVIPGNLSPLNRN